MSEFYILSEQPVLDITVSQEREIIRWAEANVQEACNDLADHAEVFDGRLEAGQPLSVHVLFGGDWDISRPASKPIYELLRDIAGSICRGGYPAPIWLGEDQAILEAGLQEIEAVIAEIRALYISPPSQA